MKIAIPVLENTNESKLSEKFARAPYFVLVDKDTKSYEIVENRCLESNEKVGFCVTEFLFKKHNVEAIVAYELGIRVQQIADEKQIQLIIIDNKHRTLNELLTLLKIEIKE